MSDGATCEHFVVGFALGVAISEPGALRFLSKAACSGLSFFRDSW
jgi:hypothetical protein